MKRISLLAIALAFVAAIAAAQTQNLTAIILPSAARTAATVESPDQTNQQWRGAHIIVNVSAYTSGSYTTYIQGKDPVSGAYYNICVGTALSATGMSIYKIYPGITPIPNGACSDIIPRIWRVQLVGASSPSMTFSVAAVLQE